MDDVTVDADLVVVMGLYLLYIGGYWVNSWSCCYYYLDEKVLDIVVVEEEEEEEVDNNNT